MFELNCNTKNWRYLNSPTLTKISLQIFIFALFDDCHIEGNTLYVIITFVLKWLFIIMNHLMQFLIFLRLFSYFTDYGQSIGLRVLLQIMHFTLNLILSKCCYLNIGVVLVIMKVSVWISQWTHLVTATDEVSP